jgi:phosphate transport system substrate-binding protein
MMRGQRKGMRRALWWSVALLVLCACAPTTASPAPEPTPQTIVVAGAAAMAPLLRDLAAAFEAQHAGTTVIVEEGNTYQGVVRVAATEVDLGACALMPQGELWSAPLALDAIAIIVHPDNPVQDLTLVQLRELLSGRAATWHQVGVNWDRAVTVVSREGGSGVRLNVEAAVMPRQQSAGQACVPAVALDRRSQEVRLAPCPVGAVTSTAVVRVGSAAVVDYVAAHPGAIGYLSHGVRAPQVKAIQIEGTSTGDKAYPFVQPFFLVARQEPVGAARQFVDFALSAAGQDVVGRRYRPVPSSSSQYIEGTRP